MVLASARSYAWDFCLAPPGPEGGEPYRLRALRAFRHSHANPAERRSSRFAQIELAVSSDLATWNDRGRVLEIEKSEHWELRSFWPGCIVERRGTYHLFYAALGVEHQIQIGLATSDNLVAWTRHANNPLTDQLLPSPGHPRDATASGHVRSTAHFNEPWVVFVPAEDAYYLFFITRARYDDAPAKLHCARSDDLISWTPLGPVATPELGSDVQSIQVVELAGRFYLLYTLVEMVPKKVERPRHRRPLQQRTPTIRYLAADQLLGPYLELDQEPLLPPTYACGRIVMAPDGQPVILATCDLDDAGRGLGVVSDPARVRVLDDGRLQVDADQLLPAGWRLTNDFDRLPAAFVERGLELGLLSLDRALALADSATAGVVTHDAPVERVTYDAAILQGGKLEPELRRQIERRALDLALTASGFKDAPRSPTHRQSWLCCPR
jgi:hypothetical protein